MKISNLLICFFCQCSLCSKTAAEGAKNYSKMHDSTIERKDGTHISLLYPESMFLKLQKTNGKLCNLFLTYMDDKPIAGIALLYVNKKRIFLWNNSSLRDYWNKSPTNYIVWETIKWAKREGFEKYDI